MRERSRTPLLLMELAVMVLVFSICVSVCLSIFSISRKSSASSGSLTNAVSWASSVAEVYKSTSGDVLEAAKILDTEILNESAVSSSFILGFDSDWNRSDQEPEYMVRLTQADNDSAYIDVTGSDGEIFSLDVKAVANER